MSKNIKMWIMAVAGSLGFGVCVVRADLEVEASVSIHATADFYTPLEAHGAWVEVGGHGRCWHPAGIAADWRPYCNGHWVWTDCGWYWESDEPWSWACYHYGSWISDPGFGWVWVPAIEWGPAWVSWRFGGDYVGWAPLGPPGMAVVAGPQFVFVQSARFHESVRPSTVVINNTTIINKTTVVNNVRRETKSVGGGAPQKVVFNEGPGLERIQKATGNRVQQVAIRDAVHQTPAPAVIPNRANSKPAPAKAPSEQPQSKSPPRQAPEPNRPKVEEKKAPENLPKPPSQPRTIERAPLEKRAPEVEKRGREEAVKPVPQPPREPERPQRPPSAREPERPAEAPHKERP